MSTFFTLYDELYTTGSAYINYFLYRLHRFMRFTTPFVISCAPKKLFFFLCLETSIVCAIFYRTIGVKFLALAYLSLKFYSYTLIPQIHLVRDNTSSWYLIFALFILDLIIVNCTITSIAMGHEKGDRLWQRVTPRRQTYETLGCTIYTSVKTLLLTGELCNEKNRFLTLPELRDNKMYPDWIFTPEHYWRFRDYMPDMYFIQQCRRYPFARWSEERLDISADMFYTGQQFFYLRHLSRMHYSRRECISVLFPWQVIGSHVNTDYYEKARWSFVNLARVRKEDAIEARVRRGSIWPDFTQFTSLVELDTVSNLRYGILFILALSSLTVYSIILAGWSSNSKYAFLGALRSAAQMISYEVSISLALLPVILLSGSLNLTQIVFSQATTIWYIFPLLPVAMIFLVSMLAETNRTPFDLPEAEAELVAGYNVDYSSLPFAMFFLGEYANMILISVLFCILFLGGWEFLGCQSGAPFILAIKAAVPWIFFVLVRATLPRYRYDQLMDIGWKAFLPITGAFLVFVIGLVVFLDVAPVVEELPF